MKIRTDFVTNSSSSSFILAFRDEKELGEFHDRCEWLEYGDLSSLVKRNMDGRDGDEARKKTEELLRWSYVCQEECELIAEKLGEPVYSDKDAFAKYLKEKEAFLESEEYKEKIEEYLATTDYPKKKEKLDSAEYICEAMIWDTNGGILEWAIRNGFLESEFLEYCLVCWNVG